MADFYSALGAGMAPKSVKVGSVVYQGALGDLEVMIYLAKKSSPPPIPQISMRFLVENVAERLKAVSAVAGVQVLMDVMDLPDGKKAIVLDPDGHSIELIQLWAEAGEEQG